MNANELIEAYLKLEAEADKDTGNEGDECFAMGKRDGFHDAVQLFDLATGGDGEFFGSTEPGGTVDVPVMAERIVERLAAAQTRTHELDDALQAACAERDAAQARMKELDREITAMRADKILFLPRPGHTDGAISFDLSVVDMEGAIRNKLIEMGWTPPALIGEPR